MRCFISLAILSLSFVTSTALAAPPKLTALFPTGGQRGETVAITATGEFSNWPVELWSDRPGITPTCEKDKGNLKLAIAADAAAGTYWLRLYDGEGATVLRPFIVGTLPETIESEPNDTPDKPQAVAARVVVSGKLGKAGDVDAFRLPLKQGETLVAAVQANSVLGSPIDAVLQVCELASRPTSNPQQLQTSAFVVQQNHDAIGLDPLVTFVAPRDGDYLVRLFAFPAVANSSISFTGGDTFIYRLTLTTGGYLDHAFPVWSAAMWSARSASGQSESNKPETAAPLVRLGGWKIPSSLATIALPVPGADSLAPPDEPLAWIFHPDLAGAIALPRSDRPSIVATAGTLDQPQELLLPVTVSGQLAAPGETAVFAFAGVAKQKVRLRVESRGLGYATDMHLAALDDAGAVLAEIDDGGRDVRDPQLIVIPKVDGRVRVVVRDLHRRGGPRIVYRLIVEPVASDFGLSLAADSFVLTAAGPLEIPVTIDRRDGFAEDLELSVIGLPAGISAEPVVSQAKGDSAKSVKLVLKAAGDDGLPWNGPIRIEGRAAGASALVRSARFSTTLPLADKHWAAWLTARK